MTSSNLIRTAAILLAAISCGSALATDGPALPSRTVNYSDLNLTSSTGVVALYKRIESAATTVCQLPQGTRRLLIEDEARACRADAIDRAIAQVNLPALSAVHFARTGRKLDNAQYADRR